MQNWPVFCRIIEYADQAVLPAAHEIDSRHGYAMLLMVLGSVAISFGGLVLRSIEVADTWQINVYRSFGMLVAITTIVAIQNRGRFFAQVIGVQCPAIDHLRAVRIDHFDAAAFFHKGCFRMPRGDGNLSTRSREQRERARRNPSKKIGIIPRK